MANKTEQIKCKTRKWGITENRSSKREATTTLQTQARAASAAAPRPKSGIAGAQPGQERGRSSRTCREGTRDSTAGARRTGPAVRAESAQEATNPAEGTEPPLPPPPDDRLPTPGRSSPAPTGPHCGHPPVTGWPAHLTGLLFEGEGGGRGRSLCRPDLFIKTGRKGNNSVALKSISGILLRRWGRGKHRPPHRGDVGGGEAGGGWTDFNSQKAPPGLARPLAPGESRGGRNRAGAPLGGAFMTARRSPAVPAEGPGGASGGDDGRGSRTHRCSTTRRASPAGTWPSRARGRRCRPGGGTPWRRRRCPPAASAPRPASPDARTHADAPRLRHPRTRPPALRPPGFPRGLPSRRAEKEGGAASRRGAPPAGPLPSLPFPPAPAPPGLRTGAGIAGARLGRLCAAPRRRRRRFTRGRQGASGRRVASPPPPAPGLRGGGRGLAGLARRRPEGELRGLNRQGFGQRPPLDLSARDPRAAAEAAAPRPAGFGPGVSVGRAGGGSPCGGPPCAAPPSPVLGFRARRAPPLLPWGRWALRVAKTAPSAAAGMMVARPSFNPLLPHAPLLRPLQFISRRRRRSGCSFRRLPGFFWPGPTPELRPRLRLSSRGNTSGQRSGH